MTVIPVAYRLTVEGAASVQGALGVVGAGANQIGENFKKIAGDIDTVGGKGAQVFARFADDIGSVAGALGTGGLAGAVTLAAVAYGKFQPQIDKAMFGTSNMIAATGDLVGKYTALDSALKVVLDRKKQKSAADLEEVVITRQAVLAQAQANAMLVQNALIIAESRKRSLFLPELAKQLEEEKTLREKAVQAQIEVQTAALGVEIGLSDRHKAALREAIQTLNKLRKEDAEKQAALDKERIDRINKIADAEARADAAEEARLRRLSDARADAQNDDEDATNAAIDRINAQADAEARADHEAELRDRKRSEQINDAALNEADAQRRVVEQLRYKATAEEQAAAATLMHAQAQTAISAVQMVATPIVDELTGALGELGKINRDNLDLYRMELQELPALLAQKAQAIMAQIAVEAAGRAVMETGAAAGALATGLGLAALGQPGAPAAFASAAAHATAASVYATISGGAGTAALGIGLTRGSGGLFQLTKEEADERNKRLGRGDYADRERGGGGGGGATGRVGGMGRGGGGGPQETVINIVYQAGSVGGDDARTAQTVVRGMRVANRSAFMRQVEGG